ncbi:MAG: hypothetical protein EOO69_08660 [Moraxellaceae bacterium]|nr:MAG: hypothetical protein EOO69_08660 [Moraxellaceae bacterium]
MRKGYLINYEETFKGYKVLQNLEYWYNTRNLESILKILEHCRETMTNPVMYQIEFSYDPDKFNKSVFLEVLRRKWKSEWKKYEEERKEKWILKYEEAQLKGEKTSSFRSRKIPEFHYIYSFEFKEFKPAGIRRDRGKIMLNYHHCHFMFIVDLRHNQFGIDEVVYRSINAFKKIEGINKGKNKRNGKDQNPRLNYRKTEKPEEGGFIEARYHDLKTEFEDAFTRASYLSKTSQKAGVMTRNSFGSSIKLCKVM